MTTKNNLPAEWDEPCSVMLAWPHEDTDWNYMLPEAQECYDSLVRTIARHAPLLLVAPDTAPLKQRFADLPADSIIYFDAPTNDTWTRDYGPITVLDADNNPVVCDFGFNAWGGKFAHKLDNAVTAAMHGKGLLRAPRVDLNSFILEGGSIESDGRGTILTTESCLLTPTRNPGLSKAEIEAKLAEILGARKVLWLGSGEILGDDTDGHIDTIARLAPGNIIFYCDPAWTDPSDPQAATLDGVARELGAMTDADGRPFNLIPLPMPAPVHDREDGHRLPATYANFLIINDAVIMPTYGQPRMDQYAEMALRVAFPDRIIEKVDCRALIRQHGSLHCATMQIPKSVLPL